MVREGSFQADVARAVNSLGQLEGIDFAPRIPVGQAVEPPADAPDLETGYGSPEQRVEACATTPNPERNLISGEDSPVRSLEGNLCDSLHLLHTVT